MSDDENARVMAEPWCSFCNTFGHSAAHHYPKTAEQRIAELTAKTEELEERLTFLRGAVEVLIERLRRAGIP